MPNGTKLYFENHDINFIIEGFNFFTLIFLEIFFILNFFSVFCSCDQTTPVISLDPNGAFTKSPGFNLTEISALYVNGKLKIFGKRIGFSIKMMFSF